MVSLTQWTWVWVNSGSWWWTGSPGMLQSMGLQRVGHDWASKLNWTESDQIRSEQLLSHVQLTERNREEQIWLHIRSVSFTFSFVLLLVFFFFFLSFFLFFFFLDFTFAFYCFCLESRMFPTVWPLRLQLLSIHIEIKSCRTENNVCFAGGYRNIVTWSMQTASITKGSNRKFATTNYPLPQLAF